MIEGVKIKQLRFIPDERGRLMEILRDDEDMFEKFGQVYLTTTYPQVIKAWHFHKLQDDHFVCIKGMVKLVLFDSRKDSPTEGEINEFFIGEHNLQLIRVPKLVYHGWKCISETEAWVLNIPTMHYNYDNPDEYRLPWNTDKIPYDWSIRMG
ncbi:MAG: dTDP-4-dehydrorhamnose 3,5-epimerase [Calditrichaeota bacterium]|nr:MAG: dTDP-4-dehydrorhamnose 3,5-epimerase [Calditrichota bacterium]